MDSSMKELIDTCVDRLIEEFESWNNWLEPDYKMYPCPDKQKVKFAFDEVFFNLGIKNENDQKVVVEKAMDIYGEHENFNFYGPNPLDEFSSENIEEQQITVNCVRSYIEAFPSLNSDGTQRLLSALEQDLEFMETVSHYLSNFYINGKYKIGADSRKKELVDFCLQFAPQKAKVYSALERLWATIYQEDSNGKGDKFKSAYSRAKNAKGTSKFTLKKDVSRYSE